MTDQTEPTDRAIAAFMGRVADTYGRNRCAPDPSLIWLRARLEHRREREQRMLNARALSFRIALIALAITGFIAVRALLPVLAGLGTAAAPYDFTAAALGLGIAILVPLVWFFGVRPFHDAH